MLYLIHNNKLIIHVVDVEDELYIYLFIYLFPSSSFDNPPEHQ